MVLIIMVLGDCIFSILLSSNRYTLSIRTWLIDCRFVPSPNRGAQMYRPQSQDIPIQHRNCMMEFPSGVSCRRVIALTKIIHIHDTWYTYIVHIWYHIQCRYNPQYIPSKPINPNMTMRSVLGSRLQDQFIRFLCQPYQHNDEYCILECWSRQARE